MDFYDILEQTKYQITVSRPTHMEDLSDLFITKEELDDLGGGNLYFSAGDSERKITLCSVITTEVTKWGDKLIASGKKTLPIDDEELLDVLKTQGNYLSDFTNGDTQFGRHGDRICYASQYKRKKTKVTQGDVNALWNIIFQAWQSKFNVCPSHVPRYERGVNTFKAYKSIVGWRRTRAEMHDKKFVKFYRLIWDNPEEYIT